MGTNVKVENQCSLLEQYVIGLGSYKEVEDIRKAWQKIKIFYENNTGYVNDNGDFKCTNLVELVFGKINQIRSNLEKLSETEIEIEKRLYSEFLTFANNFEDEYSDLKDKGIIIVDDEGNERKLPGVYSIYEKLDNDEIKMNNPQLKEDYEKGRTKLIEETIKRKIQEFIDDGGDFSIDNFNNINSSQGPYKAEETLVATLKMEGLYINSRNFILSKDRSLEVSSATVESANKVIEEFNVCKSGVREEIKKLSELYASQKKEGIKIDNLWYFSQIQGSLKELQTKVDGEKLKQAAGIAGNQEVVQEYQEFVGTLEGLKENIKADTDIEKLRRQKKDLDNLIETYKKEKGGDPSDFEDFLKKHLSLFYVMTIRFADEEQENIQKATEVKNDKKILEEFEEYLKTVDDHYQEIEEFVKISESKTLHDIFQFKYEIYDLKGMVKDRTKDGDIKNAARLLFDVSQHHLGYIESGRAGYYRKDLNDLEEVKKILVSKKDSKEVDEKIKPLLEKGLEMVESLKTRAKIVYCKKIETIKSMGDEKRSIESAKKDIENAKTIMEGDEEKKIEGLVKETERWRKIDERLPDYAKDVKEKIGAAYSVIDGLVKCKKDIDQDLDEARQTVLAETKRLVGEAEKVKGLVPDLPKLAQGVLDYVSELDLKKITGQSPGEKPLPKQDTKDVPPPEKKDEKQTTTTVTRVDELFTSLPDKPREDITRDSAP
ncbi:hypothetical protein KY342_04845, partial [Candidatus Woesearchaeota archaeon]|nr:hypothetical protein [Candidatus Woesearchaeota archaeon]